MRRTESISRPFPRLPFAPPLLRLLPAKITQKRTLWRSLCQEL
jgi:hypothetical protein